MQGARRLRRPSRATGLAKGVCSMQVSVQPMAAMAPPLPSPECSGDELFRMGLLYSTGQGGAPVDYVSAHMLFNLAAMRGSLEAKAYRKELSEEMASDGIAEA